MKKQFKNTSTIIRKTKDKSNPYTMLSNNLLKLDGYERAIMFELLSNDDKFIINKNVVFTRLGFPRKKFNEAWTRLQNKFFISCDRKFGSVHWVINEDPKCSGIQSGHTTTTDISNTDISNTDGQLINNKVINKNKNNLSTLDLKSKISSCDIDKINNIDDLEMLDALRDAETGSSFGRQAPSYSEPDTATQASNIENKETFFICLGNDLDMSNVETDFNINDILSEVDEDKLYNYML
jgi:hypothetical protein